MSTKTTDSRPEIISSRRTTRLSQKSTKHSAQGSQLNYARIILFDAVLLNVCLITAISVKAYWTSHPVALNSLTVFLILSNGLWILVASFTDIYSGFDQSVPSLKIRDLFSGSLIYFGALSLLYDYLLPDLFDFPFLLGAFIAFLVIGSAAHYGFRSYYKNKSNLLSYAVSGGSQEDILHLEQSLKEAYGLNIFCVGRFGNSEVNGVRDLGNDRSIMPYLKANLDHISTFIYLDSHLKDDEVQRIVQLCRSSFIEFEVIPSEFRFFEKGAQVEQLAQLPIFRRKREPLCLVKNKILKRTMDIILSSMVVLLIFPWLFPTIAILIKLQSPGPVFFSQDRTGYWNRPFKLLKFRTMRINSESDKRQATKDDNRITPIGAFLRKTSLDEFPQFINVLRGEMSIVGPRPHMLQHTEDYARLINTYMIRHEVKPGITGWAQVSGWRGPTEEVFQMEMRVEHDVQYIEGWSFWFDCKCIVLTVLQMIRGEKNAF